MKEVVAKEAERYRVGVAVRQEDWWEEGPTEQRIAGYDTA